MCLTAKLRTFARTTTNNNKNLYIYLYSFFEQQVYIYIAIYFCFFDKKIKINKNIFLLQLKQHRSFFCNCAACYYSNP